MTTYDQVWTTFLNNCKVSDIDLPQTDEKIYEEIKNAVMHYNVRRRESITCDDISETLSKSLDNDNLLLLAHFVRLVFLRNQKTFYEGLWQPFQKDVGLKNYATQLKSIDGSVKDQEKHIEYLIMHMEDDFL